MQGIFVVCFCVLLGVLLLAGVVYNLLRIPAQLIFSLQADRFCGSAALRIKHPLLRYSFRFRVSLLEPFTLYVERLRKDGSTHVQYDARNRKKKESSLTRQLISSVALPLLEVTYYTGIAGEPAGTALACGALSAVTSAAFPFLLSQFKSAKACVRAVPIWDDNTFLLNLEGIARASSVQIIHIIFSDKRRSRHDASH